MSPESAYQGPERRQFPRLPVEAPIEVLYPSYWETEPARLLGMTRNLSEGGVCFATDRPIPCRDVVLHLDYQGMGAEYVQGTILEEHPEPAGRWRYHCQIHRMLGAVDPMSALQSTSVW